MNIIIIYNCSHFVFYFLILQIKPIIFINLIFIILLKFFFDFHFLLRFLIFLVDDPIPIAVSEGVDY